MTRIDPQPWMTAPATRRLMAALGEARFVGGEVRNALLDRPVSDVQIATPLAPHHVERRLAAAGIKAVPTGIEHGTITAVVDGKPFEVTTLRHDVKTDGRHAVVAFTADWAADAHRRDFTMNALYAAADGEVFDYTGGIADLKAGRVRFVGDPATRIREDYLRILRLFRFHAWYGRGDIDAAGVAAAEQEKAGIAKLSGERIAKEMLRLLEAEKPAPVLRTMAAKSILSWVVPGDPDIARLESLAAIESANGGAPDGLLRLAALLPGADSTVPALEAAEAIAGRWRLSTAQRTRLEDLARGQDKIALPPSVRDAHRMVYRLGARRFADRLLLAWAEAPGAAAEWRELLAAADWPPPHFPLTGAAVMRAGVPEGPLVGRVLAEVENWWVDNDFAADPAALAERLKQAVRTVR